MELAPRHLRCWAAKRMVWRILLDPSTFPTDWDIACTGLVNAFQQTFQCMPKGLGEVSIPNPYQKVKDKLTWSCRYFTNTYSIQSQRRQRTKTLLSCFLSYLYHLIWAQLCSTVPNPIRCWAASWGSICTQLCIGVPHLLPTATQSYWSGLVSS